MESGLSPYIIKAIKMFLMIFNESVNPSFIQLKLEWLLEHVCFGNPVKEEFLSSVPKEGQFDCTS